MSKNNRLNPLVISLLLGLVSLTITSTPAMADNKRVVTGAAGPQGPAGPQGAQGAQGATGPAGSGGGASSFLNVTAPVVYAGTHLPGEFNFNQINHISSAGTDISITGADSTHDGHIIVNTAGLYQITFSISPKDNNGAIDTTNSTALNLSPDHCAAEVTINDGNIQGIGGTAFYVGALAGGPSNLNYIYNTGGASTILNLSKNDLIQIGPINYYLPCVADDNGGWARNIGSITVVKLN